ncbi:MAG: endonuclease/exonuclease/phosphatase family protein [Haloarculaceae archaeon]
MDGETVRVLSYNVRRDVAADGDYDWAGRRDAVVSTIRFHRPDVVGLQEPLAHQYDDLREALGAFTWVGTSREAGDRDGEFCPVGVRTDRFDRLGSGTFWLSETPDEPGSVGWDATYPRVVTWVRLRDRHTGERLAYLNTHFDHEGERARPESARLLRDRVRTVADGATVAVGGDFNCTPDGPAYAVLAGGADADPDPDPDAAAAPGAGRTDGGEQRQSRARRDAESAAAGSESRLVDARLAAPHAPHGPGTTRTDFESLLPDERIDHVFVDGFDVAGYGVGADLAPDGSFPSDHLPVVVDLSLPDR